MGNISGFFAAIPLDWFVIGGIMLVFIVDTLRSGLGRVNSVALALPLVLFSYSFFAETMFLKSAPFLSGSTGVAVVLGILFILCFFIVRRMGLEYIDDGMGQPIQALVAGVAIAVIVIVFWMQLPSIQSYFIFGPQIQALFAEQYRLFWLIGAYASLAFARG